MPVSSFSTLTAHTSHTFSRPDFLVVTEDDRYGDIKRQLCARVRGGGREGGGRGGEGRIMRRDCESGTKGE